MRTLVRESLNAQTSLNEDLEPKIKNFFGSEAELAYFQKFVSALENIGLRVTVKEDFDQPGLLYILLDDLNFQYNGDDEDDMPPLDDIQLHYCPSKGKAAKEYGNTYTFYDGDGNELAPESKKWEKIFKTIVIMKYGSKASIVNKIHELLTKANELRKIVGLLK